MCIRDRLSGVYNPDLPVHTSWDLGVRDKTAVWYWQLYTDRAVVVDFYETDGVGIEQIAEQAFPELNPDLEAAAAQCVALGRTKPFRFGKHYLPHDILHRDWGAGGRSRFQIMQGFGFEEIHVGSAAKPAGRIAASRALLPVTHFCPTERVALGIKRLRDYRRRYNDMLQSYTDPLHDIASHGADAFGEYAVNCALAKVKVERQHIYDEPDIRGLDEKTMQIKIDLQAYLRRKEREARL